MTFITTIILNVETRDKAKNAANSNALLITDSIVLELIKFRLKIHGITVYHKKNADATITAQSPNIRIMVGQTIEIMDSMAKNAK